jgi:hypothetical protein
MAAERVGDMTLNELHDLIEAVVTRRLLVMQSPQTTRSVKEINESIRRNRRPPRPGTPSTLELLREDRDR